MCKVHRLVYHSTLGLRVIQKKRRFPLCKPLNFEVSSVPLSSEQSTNKPVRSGNLDTVLIIVGWKPCVLFPFRSVAV